MVGGGVGSARFSASEGTEESGNWVNETEGGGPFGAVGCDWDNGGSLMDPEDTLLPNFDIRM